jgi:hypothetical protein
VSGDGLRISAFSADSGEPVELEVDAASAGPLRDAIDQALASQARGGRERFGPVAVGDARLYVVASERGLRITVER